VPDKIDRQKILSSRSGSYPRSNKETRRGSPYGARFSEGEKRATPDGGLAGTHVFRVALDSHLKGNQESLLSEGGTGVPGPNLSSAGLVYGPRNTWWGDWS